MATDTVSRLLALTQIHYHQLTKALGEPAPLAEEFASAMGHLIDELIDRLELTSEQVCQEAETLVLSIANARHPAANDPEQKGLSNAA